MFYAENNNPRDVKQIGKTMRANSALAACQPSQKGDCLLRSIEGTPSDKILFLIAPHTHPQRFAQKKRIKNFRHAFESDFWGKISAAEREEGCCESWDSLR
jgi:hypothetical protein